MPRLKTYSKVQRVVEYSTIFSDPVANKRNLSDESIANSILANKVNQSPNHDHQPLSSTLKNADDKKWAFKPYESTNHDTESNHDTLKSKDGSRTSTRGRKKASVPTKQIIRLFSSDAEDSGSNTKCQVDNLSDNDENCQPAEPKAKRGRLTKTQSASDIDSNAPKLKSIMKKPTVKKVELKSKLKKKADLQMQEMAAVASKPIQQVEENEVAFKKETKENQSLSSQGDENEKPKKPTTAASTASKRGPRILAIINDKNDQLKDVVCDNKTKYTTTTSTPQYRRRKLKLQEDLSIICKPDSPKTPQNK